MEDDATIQHERAVKFDFHTGLSVLKIGARAFKRLIGVLEFDKVY